MLHVFKQTRENLLYMSSWFMKTSQKIVAIYLFLPLDMNYHPGSHKTRRV